MIKLRPKPEERSFTASIARGRFLWLVVAALLLPLAASLSRNTPHTARFDDFTQGQDESLR